MCISCHDPHQQAQLYWLTEAATTEAATTETATTEAAFTEAGTTEASTSERNSTIARTTEAATTEEPDVTTQAGRDIEIPTWGLALLGVVGALLVAVPVGCLVYCLIAAK